jgi:hypothetical protein
LFHLIRENIGRELKRGEVLALRYRFEKSMKLPKKFIDDLLVLLRFSWHVREI